MEHLPGIRAYRPDQISGLPLDVVASSRGVADVCALACLLPGERVLDLGCGGGLDCLIAARMVGEASLVAGVDTDAASIALAQAGARAAGLPDIVFCEASLERLPFGDAAFDVALSNCAFNLCEDKAAAFTEAARVLRPGGRLVSADVVELRAVDERVRHSLCELLECGARLLDIATYTQALRDVGFADVTAQVLAAYTADDLRTRAQRSGTCAAFDDTDLASADATLGVAAIVARR